MTELKRLWVAKRELSASLRKSEPELVRVIRLPRNECGVNRVTLGCDEIRFKHARGSIRCEFLQGLGLDAVLPDFERWLAPVGPDRRPRSSHLS